GQQRGDPGEHADAEPADGAVVLVAAEPAGTGDEVGRVVEQRFDQQRHLVVVVLSVGVGGDDVTRTGFTGQVVAETQCGPLTAVTAGHAHVRAGLVCDGGGVVGGPVHHDEGGHGHIAHVGGHAA